MLKHHSLLVDLYLNWGCIQVWQFSTLPWLFLKHQALLVSTVHAHRLPGSHGYVKCLPRPQLLSHFQDLSVLFLASLILLRLQL